MTIVELRSDRQSQRHWLAAITISITRETLQSCLHAQTPGDPSPDGAIRYNSHTR